jgi:hypothetical protein
MHSPGWLCMRSRDEASDALPYRMPCLIPLRPSGSRPWHWCYFLNLSRRLATAEMIRGWEGNQRQEVRCQAERR